MFYAEVFWDKSDESEVSEAPTMKALAEKLYGNDVEIGFVCEMETTEEGIDKYRDAREDLNTEWAILQEQEIREEYVPNKYDQPWTVSEMVHFGARGPEWRRKPGFLVGKF